MVFGRDTWRNVVADHSYLGPTRKGLEGGRDGHLSPVSRIVELECDA